MDPAWIFAYVLLGAGTGFMAGLFGIGGGGIMVPALTLLFIAQGFEAEYLVHLALGTSLAAIVPTACASVFTHHQHKAILWPVVVRLVPGIVVGTFAATFVAAYLPPVFLALFFSAFMFLVAAQMLLNRVPSPANQLPGVLGLSAVGTAIGGVSALVAIGGGTMTVPFLTWCKVRLPSAIATSAAVGLPIALAGAVGYAINGASVLGLPERSLGFVYWPAVVCMAAASLFTAPLGARLTHRLPIPLLKCFFAALLVALALQMLWTVLTG
ncbi:sulfite exporter TauE/SafE family protein [Marinimicrobium sp. ABcell2]|uniref:sulfite exporter TauE/SafE family protein n=1 Tax=Marinimicrobium sp. ABcell2 TaxID=3069751 RepID=UPI0027AF9652|nr:sulfite exporter TauE/SafE family protein [Marinimicrobium sp. ABcell2]MDQ2076018.1 sulfite exporter TauE/SafE family protein [Marinimicrobium sp. ABcell2]